MSLLSVKIRRIDDQGKSVISFDCPLCHQLHVIRIWPEAIPLSRKLAWQSPCGPTFHLFISPVISQTRQNRVGLIKTPSVKPTPDTPGACDAHG